MICHNDAVSTGLDIQFALFGSASSKYWLIVMCFLMRGPMLRMRILMMTIVLLSSDPSAQSHARMQNSKHCQAVIEEVNDRDLEKLVEENDFVAVAWFVILPKWKHSIRYIQNDFFEIVKVKSMSGSPRPARLATRQLPGWRVSTTSQTSDKITSLSSSSPSLTTSTLKCESKLLQEHISPAPPPAR